MSRREEQPEVQDPSLPDDSTTNNQPKMKSQVLSAGNRIDLEYEGVSTMTTNGKMEKENLMILQRTTFFKN